MILEGLTTGHDTPLEVREAGVAGRGVFATGAIPKGSWLCAYKAGAVYPPSEKEKHTMEYDLNGEGSYVVETSYAIPGMGKLCFDATRHYHQTGHYINHAQRPNAELTAPVFARGKWRIGFVVVRDIKIGDEVVWDYQVRGEVWSGCRLVDGRVQMAMNSIYWRNKSEVYLLRYGYFCNRATRTALPKQQFLCVQYAIAMFAFKAPLHTGQKLFTSLTFLTRLARVQLSV